MAIFKVNKSKDYTVMSNYHFREKDMSLKAKGLLSMMLSLPDDWVYSIKGLITLNKDNETSIKSALHELREFGYLEIEKVFPDKTDSGRIEYVYNIYEFPKNKKQEGGFLPLEILRLENQGLYNTNNKTNIFDNIFVESNEKDLVIKYNWEDVVVCECLTAKGEKCIRRSSYNIGGKNCCNQHSKKILGEYFKQKEISDKFIKPTLEDIEDYCKERNNNVDAEKFYDYYMSNGWRVGKNPMKDWKAAVRTWERTSEYNKNNSYKQKCSEPKWFNKEIKQEEVKLTDEQRREFEEIKNGTYKP